VLVAVEPLRLLQPSAHFGNTEGKLVYDADDVTKSSVEVTIPSPPDTFVPSWTST
jgi:polyisoprenoid-binding protein YceI